MEPRGVLVYDRLWTWCPDHMHKRRLISGFPRRCWCMGGLVVLLWWGGPPLMQRLGYCGRTTVGLMLVLWLKWHVHVVQLQWCTGYVARHMMEFSPVEFPAGSLYKW